VPDALVRQTIYHAFAEGGIPLSAAMSRQLPIPLEDVRSAIERLHAQHAIVFDHRTRETSIALPFSSVPHRSSFASKRDHSRTRSCPRIGSRARQGTGSDCSRMPDSLVGSGG
jgi:hypothetical protein